MKIASLFDGIGGALLCAERCGVEAVWSSEIEPFPQKVTQHHFPTVKHLGDITKINGAEVEPVDIIVGGSPCQDLSVAGKRAGMKHTEFGDEETTRSGLFMEQIRIVKEMRNASNGGETVKPRFMVWENVPGAFSSNKGEDFRIVLEETARIKDKTVSIPRPNGGKWSNAGVIVGDGFSIAWRTVDAQFWGVPQRRRRIYLVADFGGQSAPEILFEREGVRGNSAESGTERKGIADDAERSVRSAGSDVKCYGISSYMSNSMLSDNPHSGVYEASTSRTLDLNGGTPACNRGGIAIVQVYENHGQDSRITGPLEVSPTVSRKYGTGGNNVPLVTTYQDIIGALCASDRKGIGNQYVSDAKCVVCLNRVRRLTPLECERLQGFPDDWTKIPWRGASAENCPDGPRYKACGNSMAVPVMRWIGERIKAFTG